jgi:hypothetical protein
MTSHLVRSMNRSVHLRVLREIVKEKYRNIKGNVCLILFGCNHVSMVSCFTGVHGARCYTILYADGVEAHVFGTLTPILARLSVEKINQVMVHLPK